MKTKLTITIKKRSQPEWFSWFIVIMPFLLGLLTTFLGLPYALRYLIDVAWVILAFLLIRYRPLKRGKETQGLVLWVCLFLICTLLVYLVQYQSGLYYLWGFRNNFRYYAAFFAFAAFLRASDIEDFFRMLDKVFWLNVFISVFQFFVQGLQQDILGGIFGVEAGVNGYTNIFFSIVLTRSLILCFEKREPLKACVLKCGAALIVAALTELKFFFVEFALILALTSLFTRFTWRKLIMILGGAIGLVVCALLLMELFPVFDGWFTFDRMLETALSDKGYTSSGDLNRLNSIPRINELWLTHWSQRIFGMGLGNCDNATYAFLTTPFFIQNVDMHYTWLSYAFMYLECGWVGLIFYFGFFVLVYLAIRKIERRSEGIAKSYCRISKIMAILCPLIAIYNSSLRTEAGYMAFFVLAIPFVYARYGYGKPKHVNPARETIPA